MKLNLIGSELRRYLLNFFGWRTNKKIIVIESDDWGGIRMPSKEAYNYLLDNNIRVDRCPYNRFDTLESGEDLKILYEVLSKYKDYKGNHPIVTTNTNVVNPDFYRIKESDYSQYFYKPFTETYKAYQREYDIMQTWFEGINYKLVHPQYHGREHINSEMWLRMLRANNRDVKLAFDLETYGLSLITSPLIDQPYLASLLYYNKNEKQIVDDALVDGATIFQKIFKYRSSSFIAPVYTWASDVEHTLSQAGVKYIQGANLHKFDYNIKTKKWRRKSHFLGSRNKNGQIYLNRNCTFEPSLMPNINSVDKCLSEINIAFKFNKPAVISSHRLNFIGGLIEGNRTNNIKNLNELLRSILKKWPDVEFMTSVQLGKLIEDCN